MIARAVAVILGAAALVPAATADPSASRIVDRTFTCATGYVGGVYQIEVKSAKIIRHEGGAKRYVFSTVTTNLPEWSLGGFERGAVWFSRTNCRSTASSGPFSRSELRGGPIVSPEERTVDCYTARTVLIRIRAEFARPTSLRTTSANGLAQLRASGSLRAAEISVKTPSGRSLAYASVDSTQKALMYTAPTCKED